MTNKKINEKVTVTSLGFRKNLIAYPRCMEFNGKTYKFIDSGLSYLVRYGERLAEFITLSDGKADFYLRSDNRGASWTLLSICS